MFVYYSVRVMPHDNDTEAFFWAVMRRQGELPWLAVKGKCMK